ncbi:MAG: nitroreductase family protein [Anaerovoracaceae bacterium]
MNFLDFARERYSVRSFSDRPVEQDKIDRILEAGQVAPTALNFQPQKIYILKSEEALEKMRFHTKYAYNAPMILLVCYDKNLSWHSRYDRGFDSGEMDASIVCAHMMLQAWELGIGSVWVRGFRADEVSKIFSLPENIKPVCMLPIGYPADNSKPNEQLHSTYRPLEEMVEYV